VVKPLDRRWFRFVGHTRSAKFGKVWRGSNSSRTRSL
jgi:hypothetical protein